MKNYIKLTVLFVVVAFASCSDVIDVPVQTAETRLVIEASLDWEKGTAGNDQTISLRTSTPFFETNTNTAVTGATVTVTNDADNSQFVFVDQNNGDYTTDEFVPVLNQSFTLEVIYNGEAYTATETLNPVPEILNIYQGIEDGFSDEDIELHVVFQDPPEEGNNVFFKFQNQGDLLPTLEIGDDRFVNGNEIDWWIELFDDEETDELESFQPGDIVDVEMSAISTPYKDYLEILIGQIGGSGLFEATPVAVKGNCVNLTNPENYAHGYFRLTEVNKFSYTFE
ncbi:DUF4249 domain-containing protein [Aurantibacter crassamenti]|uniref:DUF4249 family protein n=1 Tax=Aurantibacter crassamenti TaxID=1837375 RepID=UPI00193AD49C|nr:DUF4249 family protein [Aurantibacter crassamenti]MBM1107071.1 DUF4249 domain-containing protein [Aurantibacter crassamenti]